MLNDRDEKYEGHDEGEYHFSDDDANYEIENEVPSTEETQETPETPVEVAPRKKMFSRNRLILIGVIAIVLIFVIYKMFAPSNETMQIQPVAESSPLASNQMPPSLSAHNVTPQNAIPVTTSPIPEGSLGGGLSSNNTSTMTPPTTNTTPAPIVITPQEEPARPAEPLTPAQQEIIDNKVAAGLAKTEQLVAQMQTDYAQRLNNAETQNRILQEQVQSLNARLGTIENQLNQLVQSLIHQNQAASQNQNTVANNTNTLPDNNTQTGGQAAPLPAQPETKVAYSVQAIIPGRAWLKSDNGETITVAEGDVIKELGRVIKIDPYDGIVEINTGNHVVSLSYGNQG